MPPLLPLALLLLLPLTLAPPAAPQPAAPQEDDARCLSGVKDHLRDPDQRLATWNFANKSAGAICEFSGILCWNQQESRVLKLSLSGFGLQGAIPSALQYCRAATGLDLSNNAIDGPIPPALCDWLPFLVSLDLSGNRLSGPLPSELANCRFLNSLKLNDNSLSGHVHSHVDIYNFSNNSWGGRFDMPKDMAHSHLGMVTDGRYIYVVTGQYGPQCRGPTARNFVLDTETKEWLDLPPLPVPRYAPATQLWRGRLHVMGGSKEDRHEPGLEHWSLAVKDGKALEKEWRSEIPIPRGGPHRACVVANGKLLAIGGQEGDFMAKPGSPIFKCVRRSGVVYSNVYMLDDGMRWKELPPMPKPDSHMEFAWVKVNNSLIIAGGTTEKHPITKKMVLVGEVFQFNLDTLEWTVIGRLPFRIKTMVGYWDGWLYFTSGQRDKGSKDPSPKKVVGCMWRTKLRL